LPIAFQASWCLKKDLEHGALDQNFPDLLVVFFFKKKLKKENKTFSMARLTIAFQASLWCLYLWEVLKFSNLRVFISNSLIFERESQGHFLAKSEISIQGQFHSNKIKISQKNTNLRIQRVPQTKLHPFAITPAIRKKNKEKKITKRELDHTLPSAHT
jgi:hypothetical protein